MFCKSSLKVKGKDFTVEHSVGDQSVKVGEKESVESDPDGMFLWWNYNST